MDDPDAPIDFTHWLVFNIPPGVRELAEAHPSRARCRMGPSREEMTSAVRVMGAPARRAFNWILPGEGVSMKAAKCSEALDTPVRTEY